MTCRRCRWIDKRRARYSVRVWPKQLQWSDTIYPTLLLTGSLPLTGYIMCIYIQYYMCADGRGAVRIFRGDGPSDTHKKPCPFIIDRPPDTKTKEGLVNKQTTNKQTK